MALPKKAPIIGPRTKTAFQLMDSYLRHKGYSLVWIPFGKLIRFKIVPNHRTGDLARPEIRCGEKVLSRKDGIPTAWAMRTVQRGYGV